MIRTHGPAVDVFAQVPQLALTLDPVLAALDPLLDDAVLVGTVRATMCRRYPHSADRGRASTPVDVILRLLVVRRLYDWSYADTVSFVADSLVLRHFCRLGWAVPPVPSTLDRWERVLGPETVEQLHARVVELARQHRVTRGRKLRFDGTVVETTIHYPTDSTLLVDGVRMISRLLRQAKGMLDADVGRHVFRNRTKTATRLARAIGTMTRKGGPRDQAAWTRAYEQILATAQATVRQAQRVGALLDAQQRRLRTELAHLVQLTERVIMQTQRRLDGDPLPATEKIVSLVEEHTAILHRRKPDKETEFGHRVMLAEAEGGIISHYHVVPSTEGESGFLVPAVQQQTERLGRVPDVLAADQAFCTQIAAVQALGVKRVIIPRQGKRKPPEERTRWFRRGQRFRVGIEGRISVAKRRGWLGRCRAHGMGGFTAWIGWGVLASNLTTLARHQAQVGAR